MQSKIKHWRILTGILLTFSLLLAFTATDIYRNISEAVHLFSETFKQLLINYSDDLDAKKLSEQGLRNLLKELDPYTILMTEDEKEPLDILTKGIYGGVGLRISIRNDTLTVISAIEGSPGMRANILPGDQILKVDTIATKGLDVDKAARLIRGKIGTKVDLLIRRPGGEPKLYTLQRERIEVQAISYATVLKPQIGYIKLAEFSRGAAEEIKKKITQFEQTGRLTALILDLRGNHGGLLEEALAVAELFTQKGDTLLFVRGKAANANRIYVSEREAFLKPEVKLVVLIDAGSASASEIVAGIVQDLDRGLVIGTSSFGKGLVQTVFRLTKDYSLKITTAKYYIPSGRLIQKPDYLNNPEVVISKPPADSIYYSRNHRRLKGGGGITPDLTVKPVALPEYVSELWRQNMFFTFVTKYRTQHNSIPTEISEDLLSEFKHYLHEMNFNYQEKIEKDLKTLEKRFKEDKRFQEKLGAFQDLYAVFDSAREMEFERNREFIIQGLTAEFATLQGGLAGRIAADLKNDPVIAAAEKYLQDANAFQTLLGYQK